MGDWRQLKSALGELEDLQRSLGEIVASAREGWRLEIVKRRREVSDQVGRIATLITSVESEHLLDPSEMIEIRNHLSAFRATLAMHQATYPAVVIEKHSTDYLSSAANVSATSATFCGSVRRALNF